MFVTETTIIVYLHRRAEVQIGYPQPDKTFPHDIAPPTCNNSDTKPFFYGQLDGITVFYIYRTHRFTRRMQRDDIGAQHSVYIKSKCFYPGKVVIDCAHFYLMFRDYCLS